MLSLARTVTSRGGPRAAQTLAVGVQQRMFSTDTSGPKPTLPEPEPEPVQIQVPQPQPLPPKPETTTQSSPWSLKRGLEWLGIKTSKPAFGAATMDQEGVLPTNSQGFKKTLLEKISEDGSITSRLTVTGGVKYVELPGDSRIKVPVDGSLHVVTEHSRRGEEQPNGSKYEYTGTVGLKGKLKVPFLGLKESEPVEVSDPSEGMVPGDVSVTSSPGYLNLRTGQGSKVEANVGLLSLPSLTLTDSSSADIMLRYETEKLRAREMIQSNRVQNSDTIDEIVTQHGVSPITGEGMDEVGLAEEFDESLNVKPGAEGAMVERNQKHGETFKVPLSKQRIDEGPSLSPGQKFQQTMERVLYGQNGRGGRLAPQESPPKVDPTLEKPEVGSEKDVGEKQEKTGQDLVKDGTSLESSIEAPHKPSVRESLGGSAPKHSGHEDISQSKGKSVRDSVQHDSGSQKTTTGPKHGTKL